MKKLRKGLLLGFFVLLVCITTCITTNIKTETSKELKVANTSITENENNEKLSAQADEQEVTLTVTPKPVIDIVLAKSKTDTDLSTFKEDLEAELDRIGVNKNLVSIVNISAIETVSNQVSSEDLNVDEIINSWQTIGAPTWSAVNGQIYSNSPGGGSDMTDNPGVKWTSDKSKSWWGTGLIDPNGFDTTDVEIDFTMVTGGQLNEGVCFNVTQNDDGSLNGYFISVCNHLNNQCRLWRFDHYTLDQSFASGINRNMWCHPDSHGSKRDNDSWVVGHTSTFENDSFTCLAGWTTDTSNVKYHIECRNGHIIIKVNDSIVVDMDEDTYTNGTYGFWGNNCEMSAYMYLTNITISTKVEKIKKLSEVLREPDWTDESIRVVVAAEDIEDQELSEASTAAELATRLLTDNIYIVPWGKDVNEQQFKDLIVANNNNGYYVDNTDYNNSIEETAAYIKTLINSLPINDQYILVNEPIGLSFEPEGVENNTADAEWPYGKWKVEHDYTYYENNMGQFADSGKYLSDFVNIFNKTGRYVITYRDLPITPTEIFVHRRPIAQINMQIDGTSVTLTSESYDLDEYSSENNGISEEEWKWKASDEDTWHEGNTLTTIDPTKSYIVQLRVKDNQNTWSETASKYITSSDDALPVAMFNVVTSPVTIYMTDVQIDDQSYDPAGKELTTYNWELYKEGTSTAVYTGSTPKTDFTDLTAGTYTMYLTVTNSAGLTSEKFARTIVVSDDTIPPEFVATPTSSDWTNEDVTVHLSFTDEGGSGFNSYQYALTDNQSVPDSYGTEISNSEDNIVLSQEGINYLHVIAKDNANNVSENRVLGAYKIDKTKPELTATITQPTTTVRNAIVNILATDSLSGVAKITCPDGTEMSSNSVTYNVTEPGTYTFKVIDNAGNENTLDVDVVIISDGVIVKYIDQVTQTEIAEQVQIQGNVNDNYTTVAKEIEGYELVLTPDNKEGKLGIDRQTVTYEYRKNSNVTVKYIDDNYDTNIIDDVVTKYKEGDPYTTEEKSFDGYTLVSKTSNTSGTVQNYNITVEYRYKKDSAGVEIKYIDQVTQEEIADKIVKTGLEKDPYTSYAKIIDGYELVLTPDNANGEMTVDKITVTYEYRKNSYVTAKYVDENSGITLYTTTSTKYKEGDPYTTNQETINGYTFTRVEGDPNGTVGKTDIEIIYYYKKNTSVTVKYVDILDNNKTISETVIINGLEGQDYTTEQREIEGYILVDVIGEKNGKMSYDPTEVIYEYKKASDLITVHIDANTNQKIVDDVKTTYKEGDQYKAEALNLPGYVVVEEPTQKEGIMGREDIIKTFYYKKESGGLVVKYVDRITGEILAQKEYSGNENDTIVLEEKSFLGYVLDERPNVTQVKLGVDSEEIIYYYKKSVTINVTGIDQETGAKLYSTKVSGIEGDQYATFSRNIDGYKLVKIPTNCSGIFDRNNTSVIYEYKKIKATVVAKYIDKETNIELDKVTIEGEVGDSYRTEKKDFENYNFVEVIGEETGVLADEEKEVIYYYEKVPGIGKVIVIYEDEKGNEILKEQMTGEVGKDYRVEVKEISGYDIVEIPENVTGKYEENDIEVRIIVKEKQEEPIENGKVVVIYEDEKENEILKEEMTGEIGKDYKVEVKEISGYDIVEIPENVTGKYEENDIEVRIIVKEKQEEPIEKGKVIVIYKDRFGNEILKEEMTGEVGKDYEVEVKEISGYDIVEIPENITGKYEKEDIEVVILVEESQVKPIENGKVVVVYEDEKGNEILKEEMKGEIGEYYEVEVKEISGYEIVEIPENITGKYEENEIEVKIIVKEKQEEPIAKGKVVVVYEDEKGNEIIKEEMTDEVGKDYKVNVKEIAGYNVVEIPENVTGKYKDGTIEVVIKIEKIQEEPIEKGEIIVKHIDKDGNTLIEDYSKVGNIGDSFYYKVPQIDGYKIVDKEIVESTFRSGTIIYTIEYEKVSNVQNAVDDNTGDDNVETGDINIELYITLILLSGLVISKKLNKATK